MLEIAARNLRDSRELYVIKLSQTGTWQSLDAEVGEIAKSKRNCRNM